jgi:hypothetical protein
MSKLTETFARKAAHPTTGTRKYWDSEIKGFGPFIGKKAKTWYFQRDVGGQTRRVLIGRYPVISSAAARQAAQSLAVDMSRGVGKIYQMGAPTLEAAIASNMLFISLCLNIIYIIITIDPPLNPPFKNYQIALE